MDVEFSAVLIARGHERTKFSIAPLSIPVSIPSLKSDKAFTSEYVRCQRLVWMRHFGGLDGGNWPAGAGGLEDGVFFAGYPQQALDSTGLHDGPLSAWPNSTPVRSRSWPSTSSPTWSAEILKYSPNT